MLADDARDQARVVRRGTQMRWESTSATRCKQELIDDALRIQGCADDLDQAARDLDLHAAAVDHRVDELVGQIAHLRTLLEDADEAVVSAARSAIHEATGALGSLWRDLT